MAHATRTAMLAVVLALGGCAAATEALNKVNEGLATVTGNDGSGTTTESKSTGFVATTEEHKIPFTNGNGHRTVSIPIKDKFCDPERYIVSWKHFYAGQWNSNMSDARRKYALNKDADSVKKKEQLSNLRLELPEPLPLRATEETARLNRAGSGCNGNEQSAGHDQAFVPGNNDAKAEIKRLGL